MRPLAGVGRAGLVRRPFSLRFCPICAKGETVMALIICPECGQQISNHAAACSNCGLPQDAFGENVQDQNRAAILPSPPATETVLRNGGSAAEKKSVNTSGTSRLSARKIWRAAERAIEVFMEPHKDQQPLFKLETGSVRGDIALFAKKATIGAVVIIGVSAVLLLRDRLVISNSKQPVARFPAGDFAAKSALPDPRLMPAATSQYWENTVPFLHESDTAFPQPDGQQAMREYYNQVNQFLTNLIVRVSKADGEGADPRVIELVKRQTKDLADLRSQFLETQARAPKQLLDLPMGEVREAGLKVIRDGAQKKRPSWPQVEADALMNLWARLEKHPTERIELQQTLRETYEGQKFALPDDNQLVR